MSYYIYMYIVLSTLLVLHGPHVNYVMYFYIFQIEDLKKELLITQQQPTQSENYEVMIADLTNQLQEMRFKVKDAENRANQQVMLGELQQQISDIKKQHAQNIVKGLIILSSSNYSSFIWVGTALLPYITFQTISNWVVTVCIGFPHFMANTIGAPLVKRTWCLKIYGVDKVFILTLKLNLHKY